MELDELNEIYRDRFLNSFFASYSMIGVLAGIVVAVASIIRTPFNSWMVDLASVAAVVQILLILLMFHLLRKTYDILGFAPKEADEDLGHVYNSKSKKYVSAARKIRKGAEIVIHLLLVAQMILLSVAWQAPKSQGSNKLLQGSHIESALIAQW